MRTVMRVAGSLLGIGVFIALLGAPSAQAAPQTCPNTFQVLHNDRIGPLQLSAGPYEVKVFDAQKLSCSRASDRFRQFLEDYDGNLPGHWRVNVRNSSFSRGGGVGFSVSPADDPSGGGGGRYPVSGSACPGSFHVLHNDYIGSLYLPKGQYRITLLAQGPVSCSRASTLFAMFLQDYDGNLPGRWWVDARTGSFLKGSRHVGFRVKRIGGGGGGGGGGSSSARRCPGTFTVLHNDRVGALPFPAGRYWLTLLPAKRQIGCKRASRLMTVFLNYPAGKLPGKWVVNVQRGAFTKGPNSNVGFRAKPTFGSSPFSS